MENTAFLLGRFLKLADLLHKNYCWYEREKDKPDKSKVALPHQLLGSAAFRGALEKPAAAMAELSEKVNLYEGWAGTRAYSRSEWIVKHMTGIADTLQEPDALPARFSPEEKVQMLLGYLAVLPGQEAKPKLSLREALIADAAKKQQHPE